MGFEEHCRSPAKPKGPGPKGQIQGFCAATGSKLPRNSPVCLGCVWASQRGVHALEWPRLDQPSQRRRSSDEAVLYEVRELLFQETDSVV
jgi:hypothetical protein